MNSKLKVLFLCTGNSCRSQMAEGFSRHLKGDQIEAHSAGVAPKGVDPRAAMAMRHIEFDYVITLCDNAQRTCPTFPAKTRIMHVGFEDPPRLAANAKDDEEAMGHYRRIRDEIKAFVNSLPQALLEEGSGGVGNEQQLFESGIQSFLSQMPEDLFKKGEEQEEDR